MEEMEVKVKNTGIFWIYSIFKEDKLVKKGITPIVKLEPFGMSVSEYIMCFCT